jgi:hypothetical protein
MTVGSDLHDFFRNLLTSRDHRKRSLRSHAVKSFRILDDLLQRRLRLPQYAPLTPNTSEAAGNLNRLAGV